MNNLKKVLALGIALALCLSAFCGCGSSADKGNSETPAAAASTAAAAASTAEAAADTAATSTAAEPAAAGQSFKIGMNNFVLGVQVQDIMQGYTDYCLKALNSEIFAVNDEGSPEKTLTNLQNMISAGVDGVIIFSVADTVSLACAQMCEEAGVPFVLNDTALQEESIKETIMGMNSFVGMVCDDTYTQGKIAAETALDMGYKTAIVSAADYGSYGQDMKVKGFTEAFTAGGGEVLAEARCDSASTESMTTVTDDLISANMDADLFFVANAPEAAVAVQNMKKYENDTDMVIYMTSVDTDAVNNLKSGGIKNATYDGFICNIFSTVLLYNYLIGNPLLDENGNKPYLEAVITDSVTAEWADLFSKLWLEGDCCVDAAYVQSLCDGTLTYDQFKEIVSTFNAETVLQMDYKAGIITEEELKSAGYTPA